MCDVATGHPRAWGSRTTEVLHGVGDNTEAWAMQTPWGSFDSQRAGDGMAGWVVLWELGRRRVLDCVGRGGIQTGLGIQCRLDWMERIDSDIQTIVKARVRI